MAFHKGLYCLLKLNRISEKENDTTFLEIITCDPSKYTMDHLNLTVSFLWKIPFVCFKYTLQRGYPKNKD